MGRLIEKCQFGPPGGFTADRKEIEKRNRAFSALRKGVARKGLNVLGWVGDAFSGLLASAAVPSGSATGATVYANSPMYRYNLTHVQPEAKKVIDKAAPYISPANHITAWTQGSWNPIVGALKLQELGPEALLLGAVFDMLTFTKGKPAVRGTVRAVDRGLARTGNKGAKGRVVSREMDKTFEGPIDLKELSNHYVEPYVTNPKGSGRLVHYDNGDRASVFRNSGSYIQDGHLYPGLTTKNLGNFTWWNLDNPYLNVHKSKGRFSPSRYIVVDETDLFVHPLKAGKTVGQSDGAGRGFILPGEVVSESPVNLSNAFILEKDPFGWWNNVKVAGNPTQQATHPWQLFNSGYSRFQLPNGKIRLLLPSHTESAPRQFVLEPQGNNKYYVHMRTWDGDKVPANMSSAERNTLFEALYNELPDGAEILFPQSGPGNYATRGTVAGLQRLSRDSRFTPGTPGTLLYIDKNGSILTYNGTSFIKKPYTNERYSREPVIMGDEWGAWEVDYPDYVKHRVDKVKLQVESSNGKVLGHDYEAMPGSVILQHMQKQGFHPYYVLHPGANLRGLLAETTRRLDNIAGRDWVRNKQMYLDGTAPYYLGYFDEAGIAGSHNMKNGINLIEPNPHSKMHLDMMHEGISHGTDNYMPLTVIDNYQSFVDKVMNHPDINPDKTTYRYKGWSESIPSGTDKWYELRATMGEIRKDMYDRISKDKGVKVNESTIESLRPEFERLVDAMTLDLAVETLRKANSYGRVYGTLGPTINPSFLGEFKGLLKLAPVVGAPLIFKYNEEK